MKTAVLLLFAATVAIWSDAIALESKIDAVDAAFDFHALVLTVLSRDGKRTIGTTHFTISRGQSSSEVIRGETSYVDGEHDDETERLVVAGSDSAPTLDSYEHSFFNADGTLLMVDTLDAKSGVASCTRYTAASKKERKSKLEVPADSFAGASELMMVVASLRQGTREVRFHAFACVPGPAIFSVEASVPNRSERWPLYPGDLVRLDMRPDIGVLNLLLSPFMPTMDAWFNPKDNWNYVGGEFDRYFRGPHVLTVRVSPSD